MRYFLAQNMPLGEISEPPKNRLKKDLIGFWVSQIVNRWWDQFMTLPCPDNLALKLVAFIPGRVSGHTWKIVKHSYIFTY